MDDTELPEETDTSETTETTETEDSTNTESSGIDGFDICGIILCICILCIVISKCGLKLHSKWVSIESDKQDKDAKDIEKK
jgi:hypothetical protein